MWEDWKGDCVHLGNVRRYDPHPPAAMELDISKYPLKLATVAKDPAKRGWEAYKITLSNETRALHLDHPIHGGQWRELILDFDRKTIIGFFWQHVGLFSSLITHTKL